MTIENRIITIYHSVEEKKNCIELLLNKYWIRTYNLLPLNFSCKKYIKKSPPQTIYLTDKKIKAYI